ncbi:GNAT family N-acetyltransferase [Mucilaginibacter limnophilus]|uniref:GNAT family N-acetyltransferase n=1 Tax=Mucilaginibacter limnophilus TaxID=1932778 RepID=A0A437MSA5_9SPHI|nr:GNAT family N-acetyltransferase [Mucilaginibacter limnophilus]RVU00551.1 GNAT family N-acetyltransferase [Mucilaginibacter limnophilus]
MTTKQVDSKATREAFLKVAHRVYQNDDNWIAPLNQDIEAVFDPQKNNFHTHGKCIRWILIDDDGKPAGRIAAFINYQKAYNYEQNTGGVGFFECIDNQEYAFTLFDTAKNWLKAEGMEAMDGPINFGENDSFWGLLVEGFTPPSYGMNYNPPYYKRFFERYGFTTLYEQITNHLDANKPFPDRFTKIAQRVINAPANEFRHLRASQIKQFAADFIEIYNDAWQDFENFTPLTYSTVLESFNKMKLIMDEKLVWFAYVNGEPAAFMVIVPDANQLIKGFNGKLGIIEKLTFLYRKWKGVNRMRAIVMGTKKRFQNRGLESGIIIKLKEYVLSLKQYEELELSWVGDFNEKMMAIHQAVGATFGKRHLTMRYIFDKSGS